MDDRRDSGLNLVLSFANADAELQQELATHLAILHEVGDVRCWTVDEIPPGEHYHRELTNALANADVVLLLLSSDFLASNSIPEIETVALQMQQENHTLRVIPVLLRTCAWQYHPWLTKLQPLPRTGFAIAAHTQDDRDRAFTEVVREIAEIAGISPDQRPDVPGLLAPARLGTRHSGSAERPRGGWRLATLAGVISTLALLAATQGNAVLTFIAAETGTCVPGRQKYNGVCVANKIADFLTCLKETNATAALSASEHALRTSTGQHDDAVAGALSRELSKLPPDDRALIARLCFETARDAGLVLDPSPDSTRSSSEPAPHPSGVATQAEDAGSEDDASADDESADSGVAGGSRPPRDVLGCGGPLNDLGLCDNPKRASCGALGSACSTASPCCGYNVTCQHGVCKECASAGSACSQQQPCCQHLGLRCAEGTCASCVVQGSACDAKVPCCDGLRCAGGLCSSVPSIPSTTNTARPASTCNCPKGDPLCSCL
jgi:hypothetical protein